MLIAIRTRLEKSKNINRDSYVWNTANALINSAESPIITMVLTRSGNIYDAGVFSIAYAVGALMLFVGQYGFRRYQSSDIREKYSFSEYYGIRILTCIAMMIAVVLYCVYGVIFRNYNMEKCWAVFLVNCLKCVQSFTDVAHGRMQQKGRLDVATKCSAIRYVLEMGVFIPAYLITENLVASLLVSVIVSTAEAMLTSMNAIRDYAELKPTFNRRRMVQMLIEGFPLFISLFLNIYLSNAPKYAIDAYLTEEIQAIYNIVFMPAFVVQLIVHFLFNPIITSYAEVWARGEIKRFKKLVIRQMKMVLVLTLIGVVIAATIGAPVLGWLFKVDLSGYRRELVIVMIGGGMLAYSVFLNTVITIIRMHRTLIYSYGAAAIAAFAMSGFFVVNYGILGATTLYAVIMTVLTVMLGSIVFYRIRKEGESLS